MPKLLKCKKTSKTYDTADMEGTSNSPKDKQKQITAFFSKNLSSSYKTSDPEFQFVTDMGIEVKNLQPISQQIKDRLSRLQKSYKDEQDKMAKIFIDKDIPEDEKGGKTESVH